MSSSFAAKWLLQFAVSRLEKSTPQVTIDALLCSLRPSYGGLEELRIDSDHIQASGFDVLRWHDNYHELGTRHYLSSLDVGPCGLLSVLHFASSKQCSIPHVAVSHLGSTWRLIHQRSRCQVSTSPRQIQRGLVSPFSQLSSLQAKGHTVQKQAALLCVRSPPLCHTENAASGIAHTMPHSAERGLFSLGSFGQASRGKVRRQ